MLKKVFLIVVLGNLFSFLFAYNPPAGGQNVLRISSPMLLTDGSSSAGGGFFNITPSSVVNNPALSAFEQRVILDLAGTMLFDDKDESDKSVGGAFQTGILIPSRWCVSTFLFQGVWVPFYDMHLGNNLNFTADFAKDINDKLAIGMSLNVGIFYGYDSDWNGGVNMGALYNFGDLLFMKDLRFGGALLNLGKPFENTELRGIEDTEAEKWPGITPKFGVAATMYSSNQVDIGASLDISIPAFQNFVLDAGVQVFILDFITVNSSWEYDAREYAEGDKNIIPSIGVSCKFMFNSKDGSMLAKKGWAQSEMTVSGAWKQLYKNINAVSVGATLNLGLEDTQAPEIILWENN